MHASENGATVRRARQKADSGAALRPKNAQDPVLHVRIYRQNAHERSVAGLLVSAMGAIARNPRIVAARAAS
jgi:hypothetical protein